MPGDQHRKDTVTLDRSAETAGPPEMRTFYLVKCAHLRAMDIPQSKRQS